MDRRDAVRSLLAVGAGTLASALSASTGLAQPGPAPAAGPLRVRRAVQSLSPNDPFWAQYSRAVTIMHQLNPASPGPNDTPSSIDPRSWRAQALIHTYFCPHTGSPPHTDVALAFGPWHRWYLYYFEQICGQLIGVPDFTLPYWDWSRGGGTIPGNLFAIPGVNPGNILDVTIARDVANNGSINWDVASSTPQMQTRRLIQSTPTRYMGPSSTLIPSAFSQYFTPSRLNVILATGEYVNFTYDLESQPHNHAHVMVGAGPNPDWSKPVGHMADGMSPLDPLFWLHHAQVDRMWAKWQQSWRMINLPDALYTFANNFWDGRGQPVASVTANGARDFTRLGYTYDDIPNPVPQTMAPLLATNAFAAAPATTPRTVTIARGGGVAVTGGGSARATVSAPQLVDALFSRRTFAVPGPDGRSRVGFDLRRIRLVATGYRATNVPSGSVLEVYVNEAGDPATDETVRERVAGSLAFFATTTHGGDAHAGHAHAGHAHAGPAQAGQAMPGAGARAATPAGRQSFDITDRLLELAGQGLLDRAELQFTFYLRAPPQNNGAPVSITIERLELASQ